MQCRDLKAHSRTVTDFNGEEKKKKKRKKKVVKNALIVCSVFLTSFLRDSFPVLVLTLYLTSVAIGQ